MNRLVPALLAVAACAQPLGAQHQHPAPARDTLAAAPDANAPHVYGAAHGVFLGTYVDHAVGGDALAEGYLTQPMLHGGVTWRWLTAMASLSLEPLTLERGELGPGSYGEGYVDRRHPHTYLHEAVVTLQPTSHSSLTLGRGFAPFGTDDPMVRPFVRFPVNHHLGQVLERLIIVGAVRYGPAILEAGVFNGDEPHDPEHLGTLDRVGDSWSARVTVAPLSGLEVQGSYASLEQPEFVLGEGWDQRKTSLSARYAHDVRVGRLYALLEWKRTRELSDGVELFAFGSLLGEAALARGPWSAAVRVERTERPEEGRESRYRTPWPHTDTHVLGISEWTILSARVQHDTQLWGVRLGPFLEASHSRVRMSAEGVFDPEEWYGTNAINGVSLGVRVGLGTTHPRMGRYGVAAEPHSDAATPAAGHH